MVESNTQDKDNTANQQTSQDTDLIKGMRQLEFKNVVVNLESKNATWEKMGVPAEIEKGLNYLSYSKPSIIQGVSIPKVLEEPTVNFLFQAINGSGKTGSFVVPSLMKIKPEEPGIQVIILANTRELIRQIQGVMEMIKKHTNIEVALGESGVSDFSKAQILITVPGFLKNKISARKVDINLENLKMIVYDEADELFLQTTNHPCFEAMKRYFDKIKIKPQHCLYSATFNDDVINTVNHFVGQFKAFPVKKEALRLKGVQNYKILLKQEEKIDFLVNLHSDLDRAMTMVFVNKKDTAMTLQQRLNKRDIKATILIGGLEAKERDKIIDDFRKNQFTCLISTNVLARGIDVPEVDLVINYDVPMINMAGFKNPDYANFMHRVGRTGRFGTDGLALTLMEESTDGIEAELVELIAKHYSIDIKDLKNFKELMAVYNQMRSSAKESNF